MGGLHNHNDIFLSWGKELPSSWAYEFFHSAKTICFQHFLVVLLLQEIDTDLQSVMIFLLDMVADTCNPST